MPRSSSQPVPIAVAVVEHAGRVLIGRRAAAGPLGGLWEFPGGKVEPPETPREAAARECREETGLTVRVGDLLLELGYSYEHGPVRLHFFSATPVDPAQPPLEPFRWVPLKDLAAYSFPPANAKVLGLLLARNQFPDSLD